MTRLPWLQPGSDDSVWNTPVGTLATWNNDATDARIIALRHAGTINCTNSTTIYVGQASDPVVHFTSSSTAQDIPNLVAGIHCPSNAQPSVDNGSMNLFDQTNYNKLWSWMPCTFNDKDNILNGVSSVFGEVNDPTGVCEDQVTGKWGYCSAFGMIRAWELDPQHNPSLRITHMLAFTAHPSLLTTATTVHTAVTPLPWPCNRTDNAALTPSSPLYYAGHLPAGVTIGIPAYVEMPTSLSTGGQILWSALQEFGAIWRGTSSAHGISFVGEPALESSTYIAGMRADLAIIAQHLCILTNQGPLTKNGGGRRLATPPEPLDAAYGGRATTPAIIAPQTAASLPTTLIATTWSSTDKSSAIVLSNQNMTAASVGAINQSIRSSTSKADGKVYFEVRTDVIGADFSIGIANNIYPLTVYELGADANSVGFYPVDDPQGIYFNNVLLSMGSIACLAGDILNVAIDFTNRLIWCSSNAMRTQNYGSNTWNNSSTANPATGVGGISFAGMQGPFFVAFNDDNGGCKATVNFGLSAFQLVVPDGFVGWDIPAAPIATALPSLVPALATGQFYVSGGKIYDPAGKQYIAAGLNIGDASKANQYLSLFPSVNFFRIALGAYDTPASWSSFITQMTNAKIVCEIEHHPWPIPTAYSGSDLTTESAWYASMATMYKANPYVWFGTMNEPQGGDITGQQVATYNAIRNAGAPNMILLEGGAGGGNPGQTGSPTLTASSYASMTNVAWDLHYYGWTTNYSTDPNVVRAKLLGSVASQTGILADQAITGRDGVIPVINAEFGVSTSGGSMDANAAQDVDAVTNWAVANNYTSGFAGWHWEADPYNAVQSGGVRTAWGNTLANAMVSVQNRLATMGSSPPPAPPPSPPPAPGESPNGATVSTVGPLIVGVGGHTWGLDASGFITVDGVSDTVSSSNVILLAYYNHLIYQENSSLGWWYKSVPTDTWTPTTSPIVAGPPGESPNGTTVSTVGPFIVGVGGHTWGLDASGFITVDGVSDTVTSANVILLAYYNHLIYQENSSLGWWYKSVPTDTWTPTSSPITAGPPISGIPNPLKLMPMGDSITQGTTPGGYRAPLYTSMVAAGFNVTNVGDQNSNPGGGLPSNQVNHEGIGGIQSTSLLTQIQSTGIISTSQPNVVTLLIGTNDIGNGSSLSATNTNIGILLDYIIANDSNVRIFLATLLHRQDDGSGWVASFNATLPALVSARSANVTLVDMMNALSLSDLSDGLHPTQTGYNKMAVTWQNAISAYFTAVAPAPPPAPSPPPTGLRTWYLNPGMDKSFWVSPFYTTAQWITSGTELTQLRNGGNGSPTGYVHTDVATDFVMPYWIGTASDPLIPITSGGKTINVRIPVGAVAEQPYTGTDNGMWGADTTQPYLLWTANNAQINTGSIQPTGSSITCGSIQIDDGSGEVMTDVVTGQPGGGNGFGILQDHEFTAANADSNYVVQHMLQYSLDPSQVNRSLVWPLKIVDTSFANTGSVPQGYTIGIPANVPRPIGKSRGFYMLFDNAQQYGWFYYNVSGNNCLSLEAYHTTPSNTALVNDVAASINSIMPYLCILANQTGPSSVKGKAAGGTLAYAPPPLLDLSPTGNQNVLPSTFGAWYPSGYNAIPTNPIPGAPSPSPPPVSPPPVSPPPVAPPPAVAIMPAWWTAMTTQLALNTDMLVGINIYSGDPQAASGAPDEGVTNTSSATIIGTLYKSLPTG